MSTEELAIILTPGDPKAFNPTPGNDWYPCGNADGVIYRGSLKRYVTLNGQTVALGTKLVKKDGKEQLVAPHDSEFERNQRRALCYLKFASKEDRTTGFGFEHRIGILAHQGGLVDVLCDHNPALQSERDKGFPLYHWCAHTQIGKNMMRPEILAFIKVLPTADEGVYVLVYDPDGDIPA